MCQAINHWWQSSSRAHCPIKSHCTIKVMATGIGSNTPPTQFHHIGHIYARISNFETKVRNYDDEPV